MKTVKKIFAVALAVMMLCTCLVGSAVPVSAANYPPSTSEKIAFDVFRGQIEDEQLSLSDIDCSAEEIIPCSGTYTATNNYCFIWFRPLAAASNKLEGQAYQGNWLEVTGKVKNSSGITWYKLSGSGWVYGSNVTRKSAVSYDDTSVGPCDGIYTVTSYGANIWSKPYSSGDSKVVRTVQKGASMTVSGKVLNTAGDIWYLLSDGNWVYSGNVKEKAGASKPGVSYNSADVVSCSGTYTVTSWGANIWSKPYSSGDSKVVRTVNKDVVLAVVGKVQNSSGGLWYKLSDGNWVYSSNVKEKAGASNPGVSYNSADVVSCDGTYTVTSYGANIWSKPYSSGDSKVVGTMAKGASLKVTGKVKNSSGSTWYQLSDGYWVYSSNVTRKSAVSYKATSVVSCNGTYTVTSYGANIWSKPYSSGDSKVVRTVQKGVSMTVSGKVLNTAGDTWYKLSDGNWVYSSNVTKKAVSGYTMNDVVQHKRTVVVTSWGANIWSKPYSSSDSEVVQTVSKGVELRVVAKVNNHAGSLWYQLNDGNWVYSGNVAQK